MSKYTVKINKEYFADLGTRYRNEFDNVNEALSYASKTNSLDHNKDSFSKLKKAINKKQNILEYDISCISSVFSTTDAEMKKRAADLIGAEIIADVSRGKEITAEYDDIKPVLKNPRKIAHTQYGYVTDEDGNLVYDHPAETEKYLYRQQGSAYPDQIEGTCGLCCCANILRLAGVNYDEKELVDYAFAHGLCTTTGSSLAKGGTKNYQVAEILNRFGVKSSCKKTPMKNGYATYEAITSIADNVSQGKGVVVSVYSGLLWPPPHGSGCRDGNHVFVVTSVKKDQDGNILGFFVCDSNGPAPNYYTSDQIQEALTPDSMVVTDSPIR